jgi:hypothetical protein
MPAHNMDGGYCKGPVLGEVCYPHDRLAHYTDEELARARGEVAGTVSLTFQSDGELAETALDRPAWNALLGAIEVGMDGIDDDGALEQVERLVARLRSV